MRLVGVGEVQPIDGQTFTDRTLDGVAVVSGPSDNWVFHLAVRDQNGSLFLGQPLSASSSDRSVRRSGIALATVDLDGQANFTVSVIGCDSSESAESLASSQEAAVDGTPSVVELIDGCVALSSVSVARIADAG